MKEGIHRIGGRGDWQFEHAIRKEQVDVIHAHFGCNAPLIVEQARRLGVPLIVSFYGVDASAYARKAWWVKVYRSLFQSASAVIAEGAFMRERLIRLGCPMDKVKIVHIGVPACEYPEGNGMKSEAFRVLFCGRFVEKKGLADAIRAIQLVRRLLNGKSVNLRVIGDGELRPEIESLIRGEGLEREVQLLGRQPHSVFLSELSRADVLLQPSRVASNGDDEGGAPTVLIEAQASAIPVISTWHADIPEIVRDGETGFLVQEGDTQGMAAHMLRLAEDPSLKKKMGREGKRHIASQHDIHTETAKLERIYDDSCRIAAR
jgi:glycosyltransferase involved in cell wall biosynthesis